MIASSNDFNSSKSVVKFPVVTFSEFGHQLCIKILIQLKKTSLQLLWHSSSFANYGSWILDWLRLLYFLDKYKEIISQLWSHWSGIPWANVWGQSYPSTTLYEVAAFNNWICTLVVASPRLFSLLQSMVLYLKKKNPIIISNTSLAVFFLLLILQMLEHYLHLAGDFTGRWAFYIPKLILSFCVLYFFVSGRT
jgi:hypothetical protein